MVSEEEAADVVVPPSVDVAPPGGGVCDTGSVSMLYEHSPESAILEALEHGA